MLANVLVNRPYPNISRFESGPRGCSTEAVYVEDRLLSSTVDIEMSSAISPRMNRISSLLLEAGSSAEVALSDLTVDYAKSFIGSLPSNVPIPDILVEDDGAIALDWNMGRGRAISVSVYANGRLGYAWINGSSSGHAVISLSSSKVPNSILEQIKEIAGSSVCLWSA